MCNLDLWINMPWLWPNIWWSIRHRLPWHIIFHKSAIIHDIEWYRKGWDIESKKFADILFYINMLDSINEFKPIKLLYYSVLAKIYYLMVKSFWFMYFGK